MKQILRVLAVITLLMIVPFYNPDGLAAPGTVKAFPGASGYGTDTTGGRGGRVIYVTNLNDSGPGSLREALTASWPRMILFKVSGTINLIDDIKISTPYLTIAGQTAPGEGVQVRGAHIKIASNDIIIRYLKVRSGDAQNNSNNADRDAITLNGETSAYNIVIDHSTLIWGPDIGGISFLNGVRDATISYSIIGEGLYLSNHPEATVDQGGHSMAMNITELSSTFHPTRITIHHNLLTTSADRNPRVIGGELIDVVNNIIYNWKNSPSQGNPRSVNLIKNYYIKGPMNTRTKALVAWMPKVELGGILRASSVYEFGNLTEGFTKVRGDPQTVYASTRFSPYSLAMEDSPQESYNKVLNDAGADLQVSGSDGSFRILRDREDQRIISNLMNRKGAFLNGINYNGVEGYAAISWPDLAPGMPATDEDFDGMPDYWEQLYFGNTSRGSAANSSLDYDGDGYTDLEEYLNNTNPTLP